MFIQTPIAKKRGIITASYRYLRNKSEILGSVCDRLAGENRREKSGRLWPLPLPQRLKKTNVFLQTGSEL